MVVLHLKLEPCSGAVLDRGNPCSSDVTKGRAPQPLQTVRCTISLIWLPYCMPAYSLGLALPHCPTAVYYAGQWVVEALYSEHSSLVYIVSVHSMKQHLIFHRTCVWVGLSSTAGNTLLPRCRHNLILML